MLKLRPYQQEAVDAVFDWFEGEGNDANPLIVLPTGTGKSLVLSEICRRSMAEYGEMKIVVITHVMELIKQNYDEMMSQWPQADAGIYSAGIGKRQHKPTVVFCGIQSVHSKAHLFQKVDFVIVDEAHLIPRKVNTMYQKFLSSLRVANPYMKIIGLTATPYRMDSGMLHTGDGALFDDICYEYSVIDAIKDGYLSNLITKKTELELDTTGVHTRGGEFIASELQDAVDVEGINQRAVEEIIGWGQERKHWLVFGSGVEHCRHLADMLVAEGISCETIFGDTPKEERSNIIARFKKGEIRALCSMGVLTTGFNAPNVDMIAILRPTQSAGLFVQIVGRGMRLHPDKENCLILDFARNIQRHGPIDQIRGSTRDHQDRDGESDGPLVKDCPECMSVVHLSCMECPDCGYLFPREIKIVSRASDLPVLSVAAPVQRLEVDDVLYSTHTKPGKPPSLKVSYVCGFLKYAEWICLEHDGYAQQKARAWWLRHAGTTPPVTVKEALERKKELRRPEAIEVKKEGKYDRVNRTFLPVPHLPSVTQRVAV
ncbi:SSL2 DNA or RNA helicases of superfamily II [uncultured Caudovirales phage]|uniref:SSL2 DNA or RNA helicases of superfamily II n=1 Tax=uncultured Caudovirales phage TaxID=2100421 RepID=A0A6J5PEC8_9CAUD|nr:SSL2 DNA or RNA helicases of superfamily II [uncultured Caudovirales phage]